MTTEETFPVTSGGLQPPCGFHLVLVLGSNLPAQTSRPRPVHRQSRRLPVPVLRTRGNSNRSPLPVMLLPDVGEGTQPVVTIDQTYIDNQADQTVSDVIQRLPQNIGAFTPLVNAGDSFSPGAASANLYGVGFS